MRMRAEFILSFYYPDRINESFLKNAEIQADLGCPKIGEHLVITSGTTGMFSASFRCISVVHMIRDGVQTHTQCRLVYEDKGDTLEDELLRENYLKEVLAHLKEWRG